VLISQLHFKRFTIQKNLLALVQGTAGFGRPKFFYIGVLFSTSLSIIPCFCGFVKSHKKTPSLNEEYLEFSEGGFYRAILLGRS